jgi:SAM-dependent methyltransferase
VESREYDVMRAVEDRHWWYRALHELVRARLGGATRVLDVGCGTGGMLAQLPGSRCAGVDLSAAALAHARDRGLTALVRASACALPFPDGSFEAVLALDLLYHRDVGDDAAALAECGRVVESGGHVLVHAAAYGWLFGEHDRAVHGARRYTAARIRRLVAGAGLDVVELTYRNALALPWALLWRGVSAARGGRGDRDGAARAARSDVRAVPSWLNALLSQGARLENAWLGLAGLPAGLSVWCVARKP